MGVDRGGLNYNIVVEDNFTGPLKGFRSELLKAKSEIAGVRDQAAGFRELRTEIDAVTQSVQRRGRASSTASAEERDAQKEQIQTLRQIQAGLKQEQANEKIRANLAKEVRAQQLAAAKAAQQSASAQAKASAQASAAAKTASIENRKLIASLFQTESAANRVAFTFRRLFGILAAFTIARQAVSAFTGLISSAVDFNRTVEDSEIGIAALISALGQVKDASGQIVEGPQAFAEAIDIGRDQMQKLRLDALRTTATFTELIETFQTALGPGLKAGLKLDEVRQLAVLVSQAAAAMRIPQNQLAEEIRALTTPGAATSRTSLIFTRIGLTPDQLKAAVKGGQLFELLQSRLKAFDIAAEKTQKTFTGLLARIKDAIGLSGGNASLLFFQSLKDLLKDVGDSFVIIKRDAGGAIESVTPNPTAIATLAILFDGLRGAVETIRTGLKQLDLTKVQSALALIADTFRGVAQVAVGFVEGLVNGLGDAGKLVRQFFGGFDSPVLREVAALVTRIGVLLISGSLAVSAMVGAFKLLFSPIVIVVNLLGKMLTVVEVTSKIIGKIPAKLFTWTGVLGAIFLGFNKIFETILGFPVSLADTAKLISLSFTSAFEEIVGFGKIVFKNFANVLVGIFTDPIGTIAALFNDLFSGVLQVASGLGAVLGISEDFRAKIESAVDTFDRLSKKVKPIPLFNTDKDRADLDKTIQETQAKFDKLSADIATKSTAGDLPQFNIDTSPAETSILSFVQEANALLNGLIGADTVDTEGILAKLDELTAKAKDKLGSVEANQTADTEKLVLTSFGNLIKRSGDFLQLLSNSVSAFASFASQAIVDAFDPTADGSVQEKFARFLQDIARQILDTLISLLVATAIAKAFGVPLATSKEEVPTLPRNFAEGGQVPDVGKGVSLPRPSNIPASDTVPAWLTPKEFVHPVASVAAYGLDFMEAIRRRALDPMAVKGLMDGIAMASSTRRSSTRTTSSYASGGSVSPVSTASQQLQAPAAAQGPTPAFIVGNDLAVDRLLAGGSKAFLRFISENSEAVDGILARTRRG